MELTKDELKSLVSAARTLRRIDWSGGADFEQLNSAMAGIDKVISNHKSDWKLFRAMPDDYYLKLSYEDFISRTQARITYGAYTYCVDKEADTNDTRLSYLSYLRTKGFDV